MRLPLKDHTKHPWRAITLAPDFTLLDVWRYPIEIDNSVGLETFIGFTESFQRDFAKSHGAAGALFRLRGLLGKLFGWDADEDEKAPRVALPIPGCAETTLRSRLNEEEQAIQARGAAGSRDNYSGSNFGLVYKLDDESLAEISNKTVHAFLHLGRVPVTKTTWSPEMAVYVKPRGRFGPIYMAAIAPFRHHIVYPAMMRGAKKGWPDYLEAHDAAASR